MGAFRAVAFWTASIVSAILLLTVIVAAVWASLYVRSHPAAPGHEHMGSLALTYGALLVFAVAVFSSVFFAWRRERLEARELRRQVADLRLKVGELERRIEA